MPTMLLALGPDQYGPILEGAAIEELEGLGTVVRADDLDGKDSDAFGERIARAGAGILVTCWGSPKLTLAAYGKNPQLKYMVHLAGTVRPYVEREAIEAGLLVTNWGTSIARTVAEAALMMILSALRRTTFFQFEIHHRKGWRSKDVGTKSLFERRVGLHGLGAISRELVTLLKPFGARVEAYSPHAPDEVFERLGVHRQASLKGLYAANDVVSVHASNTPENRHVVDAGILGAMKDGAVLVNTARGAIVDTDALVAELKKGRIHASLDVFEEEPLPADHPLRGLENCQLIPHCGGPTPDRRVDMGRQGLRNIKRFLAGKPVEFVVAPERYDLIT